MPQGVRILSTTALAMAGAAPGIGTVVLGWPRRAAAAVDGIRRASRHVGVGAALISLVASGALLGTAPADARLMPALMLLFSGLSLGVMLALPWRDLTPASVSGMMLLLCCTLVGYASDSPMILLGAWILSAVPFLWPRWLGLRARRPRAGLALSCCTLAAAMALLGSGRGGAVAAILLVISIVARAGLWPAHAAVVDLVERGPALPGALLLNGHWGALLILKLLVIWPAGIEPGRPVLICLAPISALYIALRALGERSPRQLLALVTLGQSAVIVGGLALAGAEGVAGAFLAWADIAVTSVALLLIVRLLEVRFGEDLSASRHLGLAGHAPRLAVYFVILALALVGLPGTLGFWAQDMTTHAMAGSHLWLGLVLMTATGLNAVSVFRLFTRLLLGRRRTGITIMADALPGERWVLAGAVLWVVLGGLFPRAVLWAGRSPRSGGAGPASTDAKRPLRHHGGDWRGGAAALTVAPPAP